jgi:hypothetical protein
MMNMFSPAAFLGAFAHAAILQQFGAESLALEQSLELDRGSRPA